MEIEILEFINKEKEVQKSILDYIEHGQTIILEEPLINLLDDPVLGEDKNELKSVLYLIIKISNNHHRNPFFFEKIEQIIIRLKDKISSSLTNTEIFDIFKSNKRVLLILVKENLFEFDQSITNRIQNDQKLRAQFLHYFYPEMKEFIDAEIKESIKNFAHEISDSNFGLFEKKRKLGENDEKICQLIQNDSIDEFIEFSEEQNLTLNETIEPSIFETNSLLKRNKPTLIEYSAFYGSLKIFNYLLSKEIELNTSLWVYSIHSQNDELIRILKDRNIDFPNGSVQRCIDEAIKCHHNDMVNFFNANGENAEIDLSTKSIKYLNYAFYPIVFNDISAFYYFCQNDNIKIVEILLQKEEIKKQINTKVVF